MKLTAETNLQELVSMIGEQNVNASHRALLDGAEVFLFFSPEEVMNDTSLTDKEKKKCIKLFVKTNSSYAGWVRTKKNHYIPGIHPSVRYNSHADVIGGEIPYDWSGIH